MTDDRGMVAQEDWEQTDVHKASRYSCGKCGLPFASPHALYAHLDAEHSKSARQARWRRRLAEAEQERQKQAKRDEAEAAAAAARRVLEAKVWAAKVARAEKAPQGLCDECGEEFASTAALLAHAEERHTPGRAAR